MGSSFIPHRDAFYLKTNFTQTILDTFTETLTKIR